MTNSSSIRTFGALGLLAIATGAMGQSSPLPGVTISPVDPVLLILVDTSATMNDSCDGGPATYGSGNCNSNADYTQLRAAKVALFQLLDANDDGAITVADDTALKAKIAFGAYYAGANLSSSASWRVNALYPVGTSVVRIWYGETSAGAINSVVGPGYDEACPASGKAGIRNLCAGGDTPTGEAMEQGWQQAVMPCYDGNTGTSCLLATPNTADDPDGSCRDFNILVLTDGASDGQKDPVTEASEFYGATFPNRAKTYAIGLGSASAPAQFNLGELNCMGALGGTDANRDGDADPLTVNGLDPAGPIRSGGASVPACAPDPDDNYDNQYGPADTGRCWFHGSTSGRCMNEPVPANGAPAPASPSLGPRRVYDKEYGPGAGYFITNVNELVNAFNNVFVSIATGQFSGSSPTVSFTPTGTAAGTAVYMTMYDVEPGSLERYGHLRKYRFVNGQYRDCNNPTGTASNPIVPCWDAGGRAVVNSGMSFVNEYGDTDSTVGYLPGLAERHWTTRRIFAPSREMEGSYTADEAQNMSRRPLSSGTGRSVTNMTPVLAALATIPPTATSVLTDLVSLSDENDFKAWAAWGTISSGPPSNGVSEAVVTYSGSSDYGSISPTTKVSEFASAALWVAGKPTATFSDGVTKRCSGCTDDNAWSPKLGWPRSSRPILVGPPVAYSTDTSYTGTSGTDNSGFLETVLTNPYTGNEAVVERTNAYHANGSGVPGSLTVANPCGDGFSGTCKVKLRRKVVYLATNDGMVHAFDERTGHELWAFIPPGMLRKLVNARAGGGNLLLDGSATVRDIKFPSISGTRYADGNWHTVMIFSAGEGGRFYFALDVTNPVDPKFLWEAHDQNLGQTVARVAVGDVNPAGNPLSDSIPGSIIFATSGKYLAADTARSHTLYSLKPWNGVQAGARTIDITDLPSTETVPAGIQNALAGEPRAVDANLDGYTDRVYFGDLEGRMHKGCDIQSSGQTGDVALWFDPALYDDPFGTSGCDPQPGEPYNCSGSEADPMGSSLAAAEEAARRELRGPIYHPADITFNSPNIVVTWGTGDIFNVLLPPTGHKNFIWTIEDGAAGAGTATCEPPVRNVCNSSSANSDTSSFGTEGGRNRYVSGSYTFNNVLRVKDTLTSPPLVLAGFLLYPEFERTVAGTGCTAAAYVSRIVARDIADCSGFAAGTGPFPSGTNVDSSNSVITYNNSLVTGLQVDPKTGALFVQGSAGSGPPNAIVSTALQSQTRTVGWKQLY